MVGCPWLKAVLVRVGNFTLYHLARLPTRDASYGFRLFSRRVLDDIVIESDRGFCYSIELLVKCHRLGWPIGEVPARWCARHEPVSGHQMAAVLSALVLLRLCHDIFSAAAAYRTVESAAARAI